MLIKLKNKKNGYKDKTELNKEKKKEFKKKKTLKKKKNKPKMKNQMPYLFKIFVNKYYLLKFIFFYF